VSSHSSRYSKNWLISQPNQNPLGFVTAARKGQDLQANRPVTAFPSQNITAARIKNSRQRLKGPNAPQESLKICRSILDESRSKYGRKDVRTINAAEDVARVMVELEWIEDGLDWYREVLNARKVVLGNWHSDTLRTVEEIARLLDLMGLHADAEKWRQETRQANHPQVK
jgi:hypothetical protein